MFKPLLALLLLISPLAFSSKEAPSPYVFPRLRFFPEMPLSETNPVTQEGVKLGRFLFYDSLLSKDYNMSCASCHGQSSAFSDSPNALSKGHKGILTQRNSMPLFNLAWYPSFFWDGRAASLEEQVLHPVRDSKEMNLPWAEATKRITAKAFYRKQFKAAFGNQPIDSTLISKAIAQFLRVLISNQSKFDRVLAGTDYLSPNEYEGFVLMNDMTKGDCLHCHTSDADALGTTRSFSNNGLDPIYDPALYSDKGLGGFTRRNQDNGKFKIPSLRNVAITAPYMHDGRFATLEEVLQFYSSGVHKSANLDPKMGLATQKKERLTAEEQRKIILFLKTMTDSVFINNPDFANPFD